MTKQQSDQTWVREHEKALLGALSAENKQLRAKIDKIFRALKYMRDNEASYGDEYTSQVLNDFIIEWEDD